MRSTRGRSRSLYFSGEVTAVTVESTHATCSISNGCSQATSLPQPFASETCTRPHTYCYNAVLISPQSAAHLPVIDVKARRGGGTAEEEEEALGTERLAGGGTCRSISGGVLTSADRESVATAWSTAPRRSALRISRNSSGKFGLVEGGEGQEGGGLV